MNLDANSLDDLKTAVHHAVGASVELLDDHALNPIGQTNLVEQHLPLARGLARRHAGAGEAFEDLVQVGALALVTAARRYDPERGIPFAAYAIPTVDGELRRHLRDRAATVRVPRREQALAGALRRAAVAASQRLGREASLAEVADAAGLTSRDAARVLGGTAAPASLSSLDAQASVTATDEIEACERRLSLRAAFAALEPREREALALRFAGELSLREVARRLGMSQGQAGRAVRRALEKIRPALEESMR
jgi:RNA polymerase sigma-B factor